MKWLTAFLDPQKGAERLPWTLLLDADPNQELVKDYLEKSRVLIAYEKQVPERIVGILVYEERVAEWEILNVAVTPALQNQGIGRVLLQRCLQEIMNQEEDKQILIKTGDLTSSALSLYQKMGFRQIGFVKDYFVKNYPEPIFEGDKQLRNQVILAYQPKMN